MIHEHERDGRAWKAEWVVLPEACLFSAAALAFCVRLLEGLEVDAPRMAANLDARRGYVLSEPVMRALADRIGKHAAHEAIYRATMAGLDSGTSLAEALAADPEVVSHLDAAEVASLLEIRRALGAAPVFVDRVLVAAGSTAGDLDGVVTGR
jgi:adenylosuccinate lyase